MTHYEFTKVENFQKKGYASYAEQAAALGSFGVDNAAKGFVEINAYGTPDQIVEAARGGLIGDFNCRSSRPSAGCPTPRRKSLRLIGEQVLPKLR